MIINNLKIKYVNISLKYVLLSKRKYLFGANQNFNIE